MKQLRLKNNMDKNKIEQEIMSICEYYGLTELELQAIKNNFLENKLNKELDLENFRSFKTRNELINYILVNAKGKLSYQKEDNEKELAKWKKILKMLEKLIVIGIPLWIMIQIML